MGAPRRIGPEEALAMYLAMGPDRSISKLQAQIEADPALRTLSLRQLKSWSAKGNWVQRVREHETQVGAAIQMKAIEHQAQTTFDSVWTCQQTAQAIFDHVQGMLGDVKIRSAGDLRTLASIGLDLVKVAAVLSGGVSDRTETLGDAPDDDTAKFLEELRALAQTAETRH